MEPTSPENTENNYKINDMVPPIKTGYTRLYRSETRKDDLGKLSEWLQENPQYKEIVQASDRWFNATFTEAKYYAEKIDGSGTITYVDIPTGVLESYRVSNQLVKQYSAPGMAEKEFFLPKEIAESRKIYAKRITPKAA